MTFCFGFLFSFKLNNYLHCFWSITFIHFWLHIALFFDYILPHIWTTFCIEVQLSFIYGLRFALFKDHILHYFFRVHFALVFRFYSFLTTFSIIFGPPFSFIYDYIFHYFWTTFCLIFGLYFALFLNYILHWSTVFIHFGLRFALFFDYIL